MQPPLRQTSHANRSALITACGAPDQNRFFDGYTTTIFDMAPGEYLRADAWRHLASPVSPNTNPRKGGASGNHGQLNIPVYIENGRALLRMGKGVTSARVSRNQRGATILLSDDPDYFSQLRAMHAMDQLLVQTPHKLRHYQVTGVHMETLPGSEAHAGIRPVGIASMGTGTPMAQQALDESLNLATCYPFQPIGGSPLLYVVRTRPIPALLMDSSLNQEAQITSAEMVRF
ncbi:MAG: hypothetical protein WDZ30_12565 [Cellvibrionaceae bacterium]